MTSVTVTGTEDLAALTRALRDAGESGKGLRKELYAGLNRATKPIRADMIAAIPASLPSRGGLASEVHRSTKLATSTTGGGSNVGVRIRARGKHNIRLMNAGTVRHPVFGRGAWVSQTAGVTKGFLDKAFRKSEPKVRDAVLDAIRIVAAQIDRRV